MDKFVIRGGNPLLGTVRISGAKNAALPAMAAALLTDEPVILENIPQVRDIETERKLLAAMGAEVELGYGRAQHRTTINCREPEHARSPVRAGEDHARLHSGAWSAGGPFGRARVSLPGGCAIGARPIDLHIKGLEQLGAKITQEHGYIEARAERLQGRPHRLRQDHRHRHRRPDDGRHARRRRNRDGKLRARTRSRRPRRPADQDGREDRRRGHSTITSERRPKLHGAKHRIIPDRIEAGTFIIAGAITGGDLIVTDCDPNHIGALLDKLQEAGVEVTRNARFRPRARSSADLKAADVATEEYPGFATDMQAQYMALMTQAEGTSVVTENIFENRFMHAQELVRMGANIKIEGRRAIVRGKTPLTGAAVIASDLRAIASLVLAALVAEGETIIDRVYHIDRGYERIEEKLRGSRSRNPPHW